MTPEITLIQTTVEGEAAAARLASELVSRRLAACVQLTLITSVYRWDGEVRQAQEIRCEIKTAPARKDVVLAALAELHPYDTPEILTFDSVDTSPGYAAWAAEETASGSSG